MSYQVWLTAHRFAKEIKPRIIATNGEWVGVFIKALLCYLPLSPTFQCHFVR
jgi:hypothetical protein